jgi:hypothetical protein
MILPARARRPSLSDHHPAHKITDSPKSSELGEDFLGGLPGARHEHLGPLSQPKRAGVGGGIPRTPARAGTAGQLDGGMSTLSMM